MTLDAHILAIRRGSHAIGTTIAYPAAAAIIATCIILGPLRYTSGVNAVLVLSLIASAASGPFFLITAFTIGLTDTRYNIVGPLIGAACVVGWACVLFTVPAVRRWSALRHFLAAFVWLFVGAMLLFGTSGK
jgi:hypothetical protein